MTMAEAPAAAGAVKRIKDLADVLLEEGLITQEQLQLAQSEQERKGRSLGRVLIELGLVKETDLVAALARQVGLEFVDLTAHSIDPSAASLLSDQVARRYRALPIGFEDSRLVVAMSDPSNVFALDDIRTITGLEVKPVVATAADIDAAIRKYGQFDQSVEDIASEAATAAGGQTTDLDEIEAAIEDAPIVKLVNLLITQAVSDRASDIHIAERRIPQDGRIGLVVGGRAVDLRLATLPTVYGEKIVIRILDKTSVLLKLEDLGFSDGAYAPFEKGFRKPYGTVLVTGPTGSGKSTTLYATLNIINSVDRNIITVEDPVEYRLSGVNQMQVNNKAGLTFASALRSILRADPDVVLIGEIRDRETALIAMEAALTGHLVLSTLHTNDAPSAITRLAEMEVEPYLVASALDCVVAQRLARRLCDHCKEAYKPTREELHQAGFPEDVWKEIELLYRPEGCSRCGKTGYRGRIGLYEVMPMTEEIELLTAERRSSDDIRKVAIEQGMVTLREDGLDKARMGQTSLEEIFRVVI